MERSEEFWIEQESKLKVFWKDLNHLCKESQQYHVDGRPCKQLREDAEYHYGLMRFYSMKADEAHKKGRWKDKAKLTENRNAEFEKGKKLDELACWAAVTEENSKFVNHRDVDLRLYNFEKALIIVKIYLKFGGMMPTTWRFTFITGGGPDGCSKRNAIIGLLGEGRRGMYQVRNEKLLVSLYGPKFFGFKL